MTTKYLLDSNVLLHLVNKHAGYQNIEYRLERLPPGSAKISVLTVWEIIRLAEQRAQPSKASKAALKLMLHFDALPLTPSAAAWAGSLWAKLRKTGKTIGERDSMIAGVARVNDLALVSNDGDFQRVPGLKVEDWLKPA